jgi:hypothetical protein
MSWFWMNIPAALVFVGLWSGIPMWLVLRHPDRGPQARAVQASAPIGPVAPADPHMPVPRRTEHLAGV